MRLACGRNSSIANDPYQPTINYLRLLVIVVSNLCCVYCMPEETTFRPGPAPLQDEEYTTLFAVCALRFQRRIA